MVTRYLSPVKIIWQSTQDTQYIKNLNRLLLPGNGQADLANQNMAILKSNALSKPAFLLDFGKELNGGLQIVTGMYPVDKPIRLRIRFGESVSEAMSDIEPTQNATNDHAMRDMEVMVPWLGRFEVGDTGFRFVRIDVLDAPVELQLKEVRAAFRFRDIPYLGSFHSSDTLLNKIWQTGAYTVHLNMQDYLWDGIKRDRLVWVGDMHPEVASISTVFGYNNVVPRSLDLVARDITPIPNWMNGISTYSMWWIIIHRDWYYQNGNLGYLKEQRDYLKQLLPHLISKIGNDNKEKLDGNRFLDWPSSENKPGVDAGLQAMMIWALTAGAEICQILEESALKKDCENAIEKLKKHVPPHNNSKQAAALMALANMVPAKVANQEVLSVGGAKNFSTFYGYYMLQAKAKAGDHQGAIDAIRSYWGAMLALGATSFWEDFNLDWLPASRIDEMPKPGQKDIHGDFGGYCYVGFRHSLSHGWASGPTPWLTEHVLGIKVVEAGCKTIRISPNLGDLQFAEGTYPTPLGILKVKHTKTGDGKINSEINAPRGIRIIQ